VLHGDPVFGDHDAVFILPVARCDKAACHTLSSVQISSCHHKATCTARPQVLVYNFADLRLLHSIETLSNPSGIIALSAAAEQTTLACPGLHAGQVRAACTEALATEPACSVSYTTRCLVRHASLAWAESGAWTA
jgi:hypothetical protein